MTLSQSLDHLDEAELIGHPIDTDVLCGKTKLCMNHPGSKAFRAVIEENAAQYDEADSKYRKMNITKEIYEDMRCKSDSRFLKFSSKRQGWIELSESQVRDKIGHALRFVLKTKKKRERKSHRRALSLSSVVTNSSAEAPSSSESSDGELEDRDDHRAGPANALLSLPPPTPLAYQTSLGMVPLDSTYSSAMKQTPYTSIIDYFRRGDDQQITTTKIPMPPPRNSDFSFRTVSSSSNDLWKEDKELLSPASGDELIKMMQEPLIELETQPVKKMYAPYQEV